MSVTNFRSVTNLEARNEHSIVVDEAKLISDHHHVFILKIAMGDPVRLQHARQGLELISQTLNRPAVGSV